MNKLIQLNCKNYITHIVTPITPYLICNHHFSTEIYKNNKKYINLDIFKFLSINTNDLYKNHNYDKIKEGDIIQVQVDLFDLFVNDVLPKISCKIVVITSQMHLPQIHKSELTDKFINDEKVILWISQNPIYKKCDKYMAYPYGICHKKVNEYMNFVKSNKNKISNINIKTNFCYNSPFRIHNHLPNDHIRRHKIFDDVKNKVLHYNEYLNNILKSKFTISTSGDRDDCYRHYECIGLNSIPISNINYKEIFDNNMIYSNINDIINILNLDNNLAFYSTNKDLLLIDYWNAKITERINTLHI